MKCSNCGQVNRKEAIHCKKCGEPLVQSSIILCPTCGKKVQKNAKFCDDCGTNLTSATPPGPKSLRMKNEEPSTTPPVVVQVQKEEKRSLNPLWLVMILLLLLLLLICGCGGLLLFGKVEVPESVEPYIDPYLESFEPYLGNICDEYCNLTDQQSPAETVMGHETANQPVKPQQPVDQGDECEDFHDRVEQVRDNLYKGKTKCDFNNKICTVTFDDITGLGLDDYGDIDIDFQWGDGERGIADCDGKTKPLTCTFQFLQGFDEVNYYITLNDCKEIFADNDGWILEFYEWLIEKTIGRAEEQEKKEESNCDEFIKQVKDLSPPMQYIRNSDGATVWEINHLTGLDQDDYEKIKIKFQDAGSNQITIAPCTGGSAKLKCSPAPESVDCAWISFNSCEALYQGDEDSCKVTEAEESPTEDEHGEKSDCCQIVDVSNVRYEGVPLVTRYLKFDVICDGDWPVSGANEIHGKTRIGGDYNMDWADVTCYRLLNNEKNLLSCESNTSVPQKESWVKAELVYGDCSWTSTRFHTPQMTMDSSPKDEGCKNLSSDGVTCLD